MSTSSAGELPIQAEHGNKLALGRLITRIETSQVDASHVLRVMQRRHTGVKAAVKQRTAL